MLNYQWAVGGHICRCIYWYSLMIYVTKGNIKMYERFISQLQMYINAISILLKGYLPISLMSPSKLQEKRGEVIKSIPISNPYYDIVTKKITFVL